MIIVAPLSLSLTDRDPPFVTLYGEITPAKVRAGDHITVMWTTSKPTKECSGQVYRVIRDAKGLVFTYEPVAVVHRDMRGHDTGFAREVALPNGISWGPATYESTPYFTCNWLTYFWPIPGTNARLPFEVLPAPLPLPLPVLK